MTSTTPFFDAIILGGGIAGLWSLNILRNNGYNAVLIEKEALGSGQTLWSQGMIHGGIKYTLAGTMTSASETIADMPERWRSCLGGNSDLNLGGVKVLADAYYMFSDDRLTSRLTAFFGSKAIEGRIDKVQGEDLPEVFRHSAFRGPVYRLQDLVLDSSSLLHHLQAAHADSIVKGDPRFKLSGKNTDGIVVAGQELKAHTYILAAGEGNGALIEELELPVKMQLRPLHQVMVSGSQLPEVFAHAVALSSADKPKVTFTTHNHGDSRTWYLGGQLAETGVSRSEDEQAEFAEDQLAGMFPWIDFSKCDFSTTRINRAEVEQQALARPDTPYLKRFGNTIVCWPTKLTLAPMLGDMLREAMPAPTNASAILPETLPRATMGSAPWQ